MGCGEPEEKPPCEQEDAGGDGGGWIKETYDPDALFQLDRFHIYKEIKKKIRDAEAQEQKKVEEMLEYIQVYADSIEKSL